MIRYRFPVLRYPLSGDSGAQPSWSLFQTLQHITIFSFFPAFFTSGPCYQCNIFLVAFPIFVILCSNLVMDGLAVKHTLPAMLFKQHLPCCHLPINSLLCGNSSIAVVVEYLQYGTSQGGWDTLLLRVPSGVLVMGVKEGLSTV